VPGNTDAAANAGDDGLEADDVTRAELRSLAQDNNVEFASRDTKPQLVEKLRAANVRRS
jgi:cold shock CspA family protein